jgi:hypothetical protein
MSQVRLSQGRPKSWTICWSGWAQKMLRLAIAIGPGSQDPFQRPASKRYPMPRKVLR